MRIVAGLYGGRRLQVPKGRDVRPTSDKVRGAIFNTLGGHVDFDECCVLDAFCGTGALGFEALSRGAEHCLFIDKARDSLDLAKSNAKDLDVFDQSSFKIGDARSVHLNRKYDLIFLDPPYLQGLISLALQNLVSQDALPSGAVCVLESERRANIHLPDGFERIKDKEYGDTMVTYIRYK